MVFSVVKNKKYIVIMFDFFLLSTIQTIKFKNSSFYFILIRKISDDDENHNIIILSSPCLYRYTISHFSFY